MLIVISAVRVLAHPLAPSLLEAREVSAGTFAVSWKTPRFGPPGVHAEPSFPEHCATVRAMALTSDASSVRQEWQIDCGVQGLVGFHVAVDGLGLSGGTAIVRVTAMDGHVAQAVVSARQPSFTVPPRPRRSDVAIDYLVLGIEHILKGLDHLLFVAGLLLLVGWAPNVEGAGGSASRRSSAARVVTTITAFTLGHCITLSLAALGVLNLNNAAIEVGIALSVLVLAVELTRDPTTPTWMRRRPWLMSMLFGLLHGLGFATALEEAGLPAGDIPLALASFNLGIESGQLMFVALLAVVGYGTRRLTRNPPAWVVAIPVYAMGSLAAFWTFERLAAFWR